MSSAKYLGTMDEWMRDQERRMTSVERRRRGTPGGGGGGPTTISVSDTATVDMVLGGNPTAGYDLSANVRAVPVALLTGPGTIPPALLPPRTTVAVSDTTTVDLVLTGDSTAGYTLSANVQAVPVALLTGPGTIPPALLPPRTTVAVSDTPTLDLTLTGDSTAGYTLSGRVPRPFVYAEQYGLVGDDATDNTTKFQQMLDENGGAIIVFGPGVFRTNPVYMRNRTTLMGSGWSTTIKCLPRTWTNPDSVGVINVHGTSGTRFTGPVVRDLRIDANRSGVTVGAGGDPLDIEGLSFKYTDGLRVQNVKVVEAYSEGFDFDDCADGLVSDFWAENCGGAGIHFSNGCLRMTAMNGEAVSCGFTASRAAFDSYSGSTDSMFIGCRSRTSYIGTQLNGLNARAIGNSDIGSTVNNFRVVGDYALLSGCVGRDALANGITVDSISVGSMVVDTTIVNAAESGIRVLAGADDTTVTGCTASAVGTDIWHQGVRGAVIGCIADEVTITNLSTRREGNTASDWTALPLAAGWTAAAGAAPPVFRIRDGWVEFRGTVSYNAALTAGSQVALTTGATMPAPVSTTVVNGVMVPMAVGSVGRGTLNPRADGDLRFYAADAYTAATFVHLTGLRYSVV